MPTARRRCTSVSAAGSSADPASGQVLYSAYGDPRLRPDRYRSFDAGVDQTLAGGRVQIAASAFVIDVQSLTAFDFSGGINPATDPYGRFIGYLNGSGGSSKGLELALDVRPTRRCAFPARTPTRRRAPRRP